MTHYSADVQWEWENIFCVELKEVVIAPVTKRLGFQEENPLQTQF